MRDSGFILLLLLLFGWNNQAESLLRLSRPLFFVSLMVPSFWEQELTLYSLMPRSRVRNRRLSMAGPLRSRKIPCYIFFILCALSLFSSVSFLSFSFRVCSKPENIFGIKEGLAAKESLSPIHTHTHTTVDRVQSSSFMTLDSRDVLCSFLGPDHQVVPNNARRPSFFSPSLLLFWEAMFLVA